MPETKNTQTLSEIKRKKDRDLFEESCRTYRKLSEQIAELKEEQDDAKESAQIIAARYGIVSLRTADFQWSKVKGSKGNINKNKLVQNLLRKGLDIDEINKVIDASRNKDKAGYYQIGKGGE